METSEKEAVFGSHSSTKTITQESYSSGSYSSSATTCYSNSSKAEVPRPPPTCRVAVFCCLYLLLMAAQVTGGVLANSLALVAGAVHILVDIAYMVVPLVSNSSHHSSKATIKVHRAEVSVVIISVFLVWMFTGVLCYMGVVRLLHGGYTIQGETMLVTATCATGVNVMMTFLVHGLLRESASSNESFNHVNSCHRGFFIPKDVAKTMYGTVDNESSRRIPQVDNVMSNGNSNRVCFKGFRCCSHIAFLLVSALIIFCKAELQVLDPVCTLVISVITTLATFVCIRDMHTSGKAAATEDTGIRC